MQISANMRRKRVCAGLPVILFTHSLKLLDEGFEGWPFSRFWSPTLLHYKFHLLTKERQKTSLNTLCEKVFYIYINCMSFYLIWAILWTRQSSLFFQQFYKNHRCHLLLHTLHHFKEFLQWNKNITLCTETSIVTFFYLSQISNEDIWNFHILLEGFDGDHSGSRSHAK